MTSSQSPAAMMAYGLCISACKQFCDAVESCNEVLLHRSRASFGKCSENLARVLGPTKRLRRVVDGLHADMLAVYTKYNHGMADPENKLVRLTEQEQTLKPYKKFRRAVDRAAEQRL
jgi:hypothetical protein